MSTSNYFYQLQSLYEAELEDLRTDSEGNHVLVPRLDEKRQSLGFLLHMMDSNPEMLVVAMHQAFQFSNAVTMDHLVALEQDELPTWDSLRNEIDIVPWAVDMVRTILNEPLGAKFMTIAAALEYLHHKTFAEGAHLHDPEGEVDERDAARSDRDGDHPMDAMEGLEDDEADARARDEAGNDWMVEQGFDRKENL